MRKRTYVLAGTLLLVAAGGLTTRLLQGEAACPADNEPAVQTLGLMITGSIVNLPAGLQPVTHGGTCSQIRRAIRDDYSVQGGNAAWDPTYYQTADRYYAVLLPTADAGPDVGGFGSDVVIVLDLDFNILDVFFG